MGGGSERRCPVCARTDCNTPLGHTPFRMRPPSEVAAATAANDPGVPDDPPEPSRTERRRGGNRIRPTEHHLERRENRDAGH